MLDLTDPLWRKLDDAHRDRDIPAVIAGLAANWDEDAVSSLFWDCLCHQDTCYGATYAAIPHLLEVAEPEEARRQRADIAHFLGHVALVAFRLENGCGGPPDDAPPQGLPATLEAWGRKLDSYRSLTARAPDPKELREIFGSGAALDRQLSFEGENHNRWLELLSRPPVNEADLGKIAEFRREFFEALPAISRLCTDAYREAESGSIDRRYYLAGIAAAEGARDLAHFMEADDVSSARCAECGHAYEVTELGAKLAAYAMPDTQAGLEAWQTGRDPAVLDWKDGAPNRADAVVRPADRAEIVPDSPAGRVLAIAEAANDSANVALLLGFLGTFDCVKCGKTAPLSSP